MVHERFGERASGLFSNILQLGHVKVSDLEEAYGVAVRSKSQSKSSTHRLKGEGLSNGTDSIDKTDNQIKNLSDLHFELYQLLKSGYLKPLFERDFFPPEDLDIEAQEALKTSDSRFFGDLKGKVKKEFEDEVHNLKRKWRDEHDPGAAIASFTDSKRSGPPVGTHPHKRQKISDKTTNGVNGSYSNIGEHFATRLSGELVLEVNYAKMNVALRNNRLVDLAALYIGNTTSKVYEAFLRQLEGECPRLYDEFENYSSETAETNSGPSVTISQTLAMIDANLDLAAGLADDDYSSLVSKEEDDFKSDSGIGVEEDTDDSRGALDANERRILVERHIKLLCKNPRHFAEWYRGQEFKVPFRRVTHCLIQNEIEKLICSRFGQVGALVIRVLWACGAMDAKQIANICMHSIKQVLESLGSLKEAGFLVNSDMPKGMRYTTGSVVQLFSFDPDVARQLVITDTYKTMSELLRRMNFEKTKIQAVIDKAERTDVVGKEEQYLSKGERTALVEWKRTEEKLLAQLNRLDDVIAVLRDFPMPALETEAQ